MKHIRLIVGIPLIAVGAYFSFRTVGGNGEASTQRIIVNAIAIVLLSGILYVILKPASTKRQSTKPNPANNLQPDSGPTPEATVVTANQHTQSTTIASDQPLAATVQPEASVLKNQTDAPSPQSVIMAREIIYATRVLVVSLIVGVVTFVVLWIGVFNGLKYVKPDYSDARIVYDSLVDRQKLLRYFFPNEEFFGKYAIGKDGEDYERKHTPRFGVLLDARVKWVNDHPPPKMSKQETKKQLDMIANAKPLLFPEVDINTLQGEDREYYEIIAARRSSILSADNKQLEQYAKEIPYMKSAVQVGVDPGRFRDLYYDTPNRSYPQSNEQLHYQLKNMVEDRRADILHKSVYIALATFLTTLILWIGGRYVSKATHWVKTTAKYNDNQQQ